MIYTNLVYGFFKTLLLFVTGRVQFIEQDVGKTIIMEDGQDFTVFSLFSTPQDIVALKLKIGHILYRTSEPNRCNHEIWPVLAIDYYILCKNILSMSKTGLEESIDIRLAGKAIFQIPETSPMA